MRVEYCSLKSCSGIRFPSDNIFCSLHRFRWRKHLELQGLHDVQLNERKLDELLLEFGHKINNEQGEIKK